MPLLVRKLPSVIVPPVSAVQEPAKPTGGIRRRERPPIIKHSTVEVYGELANVIDQIKERFSPAVITRANGERIGFGRVASGILSVDLCLAGGLMASRGSMIYGNKSAGKTTLAARFVAAAQRMYPDKFAIWMDIEGTFDPPWAARQGVDLDRLHIVEPETGESAVDIADALLHTMEVSILVTDSIAFLTPMKEIVSSAEESFPGMHARLIGNYLRRVNSTLLTERHRGHYPVVLHLNQFRMAIGVMFGDPRVLPGGKALEFATTQQVEMTNREITNASKEKRKKGEAAPAPSSSDEKADKNTIVLHNQHSIKITKDKSGGRYKEGLFVLVRDEAFGLPVGYVSQSRSIISFGLTCGILEGSPQSFGLVDGALDRSGLATFGGKFRGAPEFAKFLVEDAARERAIVASIVDHYRSKWGVT